MTLNEMLSSIVVGATITAEMETVAKEQLAKTADRKAKKDAEYAPLVAACESFLKEQTAPVYSKDIATALGVHTSKVRYIIERMPAVKVGTDTVDSRVVKTYIL